MSQRFRSPFAVLVALVALALLVIGPAGAQTPPPTAAPATTSTTAPDVLGDLLHQLLPTTTTVAPAAPPTTAAARTGAAGANPAAPGGSTTTTTTPPGVIPPEYVPIINSVHRTGSRTTSALIDALHPLTDLGFTAQEAAISGFGHFPVAGLTDWSDNWLEPRFTPTFHLHQGDDLFAARGTPVRAPFDGVVRFAPNEGAGGNAAYLTVPDGTYYYMAHMDSFSPRFRVGQRSSRVTCSASPETAGTRRGRHPRPLRDPPRRGCGHRPFGHPRRLDRRRPERRLRPAREQQRRDVSGHPGRRSAAQLRGPVAVAVGAGGGTAAVGVAARPRVEGPSASPRCRWPGWPAASTGTARRAWPTPRRTPSRPVGPSPRPYSAR